MKINDLDRDKIRHAANTDVIRRLLIKYFVGKGFTETFDRSIHPLMIQDLPKAIPGLDTKIEIEPHALSIDPTTSVAIIGWNLFVLGNQRMFLGETHHDNLMELARQIRAGQIMPNTATLTRRETTPKRLIHFVTKVLGCNAAGYVDLGVKPKPMMAQPAHYRPVRGPSQEAQYYSRSGYGT